MADENVTLAQDINDYPMQHAGEEIDEILSRAGKIHYGTVEKKVTTPAAYIDVPLNLDFTPKQVIVTLRHNNVTPNPYQTYCTHVYQYKKSYSVCIVMGKNDGQEIVNVPTGTYYVDYIAIE